MKELFDTLSNEASKLVTKKYSTSFYIGVSCLDSRIRQDIHNIYGFVRLADEIVDSFHDYRKEKLLHRLREETYQAIEEGISLNPILNSFQATVNKYKIDHALIDQFLHSMEMDLAPVEYTSESYNEYILGSAEVVGLMCLKVFVFGDNDLYTELKPYAMKLGSAFQKINFLRDLNTDFNDLGRVYFPEIEIKNMTLEDKIRIEEEIEIEFEQALQGIKMLPKSSRFGVYVSYRYYRMLLKKIKDKTSQELLNQRVRVPNNTKLLLFAKSYLRNSMNLL